MKWFMTIGALLLTPAMALAAAGFTFSVTPTIVNPGETITVNLYVDTNGLPSNGFGTAINVDGEDILLATAQEFHMNGGTDETGRWGYYPAISGVPYGTPLAPGGSMVGDLIGLEASGNIGILPSSSITSTGAQVAEHIDFQAQATPGTYNMWLNAAGGNYISGADNEPMPLEDMPDPIQFEITPEPASMLLLIGALPFLRRRRSA